MYEKYQEELLNSENENIVNDKYNVIFKYELKEAIGMTIKGLTIFNDNCIYLIPGHFEKPIKHSLDDNNIIEILNKYAKKIDEVKEQPLPDLLIMDGNINKFDFKVNNKWYNYKFYNLGYYSKDDIDNNEFLSLFFDLLDELHDELKKQNSEFVKYFNLSNDEGE
jgi:hypothetical protein